ncbi:MAG: hypothetical protein KDC98_19630 [Planctomycetes bacterium]|nr:hypothetical protein [Planctomycetota bacterium]
MSIAFSLLLCQLRSQMGLSPRKCTHSVPEDAWTVYAYRTSSRQPDAACVDTVSGELVLTVIELSVDAEASLSSRFFVWMAQSKDAIAPDAFRN